MISTMKHPLYLKIKPGEYKEWSAWVLKYKQYNYPNDLDMVIKLIKNNLQLKFVPPKFRENNLSNPMFGHCYHVTQALYYFFKDANLKVMSAKCEGPAESHWWLQDGDTIIDATAEQYDIFDFNPPYDKGKESVWYAWKKRPNRKSQDLMQLVQPDAKLEYEQYLPRPKQSY